MHVGGNDRVEIRERESTEMRVQEFGYSIVPGTVVLFDPYIGLLPRITFFSHNKSESWDDKTDINQVYLLMFDKILYQMITAKKNCPNIIHPDLSLPLALLERLLAYLQAKLTLERKF